MTLFHSPSVQSPKAYDLQNLQANQLITRINTGGTTINAARIATIPISQTAIVQTAAEAAVPVNPSAALLFYDEGDIRRYGATTAAGDNSAAIQTALNVSQNGGKAAYIPPGTWKITTPLAPAGLSSMFGAGAQSTIAPQACNGFNFPAWAPASPVRRVFSDFAIRGTAGTRAANAGIATTVSPGAVYGITFSNIYIEQFLYAAYLSGFRLTTWTGILANECTNGLYFIGQNTNTEVLGCHFITQSQVIGDGSWGISFQQSGGNTTQSTQISGCYLYGYDIGVNCLLGFETQLIGCDISQNLTTAVQIQSTNGGFWLTNCWVETNNGVSASTGVLITAITPTTTGHVVIEGNYINATSNVAASKGISIGNGNAGTKIIGNKVIGFDRGVTIGACTGLTFRDNAINCVTPVYNSLSYAVNYTTNIAPDNTVGPNEIVGGTAVAATMANASANIGVPASGPFPVGLPVQFDAAVNGFFKEVTYYVLTSAANVLTVGPKPGGAAIVATGNTAVNVFQAPLPLTLTAGYPLPGFQFFARGSFIGTLSNPAVLGPVDWVANGYTFNLLPRNTFAFSGASTLTTMTMDGFPAFLVPTTTAQHSICGLIDNSTFKFGYVTLSTAGLLSYFNDPNNTALTAAGTKGLHSIVQSFTFT